MDPSRQWGSWSSYSKANGGFLSNASEFWTSPEASQAFASRLQYLVGRFAHHPALFAWELFNEVNVIKNPGPPAAEIVASWHKEFAGVIKDNDPYTHLVT